MIAKSEQLLAELEHIRPQSADPPFPLVVGKTARATVEVRTNQGFFRDMILSAYGYRCCITGIANSELLVASHISPWAHDEKNRMNPRNGLCLNVLHDRAFDRGLLTLTEEYTILVSKEVRHSMLVQFSEQKIELPSRFLPDKDLLKQHRERVFRE